MTALTLCMGLTAAMADAMGMTSVNSIAAADAKAGCAIYAGAFLTVLSRIAEAAK